MSSRARRFYYEILAKPAFDIFLVYSLCSCLYHLARPSKTTAWNSSYLYHLAKWPYAMSGILAFIVASETVFPVSLT